MDAQNLKKYPLFSVAFTVEYSSALKYGRNVNNSKFLLRFYKLLFMDTDFHHIKLNKIRDCMVVIFQI